MAQSKSPSHIEPNNHNDIFASQGDIILTTHRREARMTRESGSTTTRIFRRQEAIEAARDAMQRDSVRRAFDDVKSISGDRQ
jgi:hypothetical protein